MRSQRVVTIFSWCRPANDCRQIVLVKGWNLAMLRPTRYIRSVLDRSLSDAGPASIRFVGSLVWSGNP
jgi:hypothetical protein